MGAEELLDEEAFDPKKLFNEDEYSTLIIGREGFTNKQNTAADLVEDLLEPNNTRQENEEIYKKLKDSGAGQMLVNAIKQAQRNSEKVKLITACWECGLDFTEHFLMFVELACHSDFNLALEALTVVESCEGYIPEENLRQAMKIVESSEQANKDLLTDLISNINQRLG